MAFLFYISLIAISYASFKIYKLFQVPKELRDIPSIPIIKSMLSVIKKVPFDDQFDSVYYPVLKKLGFARIWMRGNWEVIISDPKIAKEILSNSDVFLKQKVGGNGFSKKLLAYKFFGSSNIVNTDGAAWLRHRKVANPAFKKPWSTIMFGECTMELIAKIETFNQEPLDIRSLFQQLTLDALGLGMFSYDFEAIKRGESSRYLKIYNSIVSVLFDPLYLVMPFLEDWIPSRKTYHSQIDEFRAFLLQIIRERKIEIEQGVNKQDLLSLIIMASSEEAEENMELSDEEVLNDLVAFFLAGHDTTANTLTSTFYYLAKFPDIQEKAYQEVVKALGSSDLLTIPTSEQLKAIPYINCIVKESMRIITTASQMRRCCIKEAVLQDRITIPSNTFISIHFWAIHHDPQVFSAPHHFNPDRFLDLTGPQNQAWVAFGSGPRMCPGLNFSLIEQRVVMAMFLLKFKISLGPNSSQLPKPIINSIGLAHPVDVDLSFTPRF